MTQPNLTYIQQLADGDKEFEQQLLNIVKKEFPLEKEKYFKLLDEKNYSELIQLVHKVKHKFTILGLIEEYEIACNFEEDIKNENLTLKMNFEAVLHTISDFLKHN